jgi:hypothetical protein
MKKIKRVFIEVLAWVVFFALLLFLFKIINNIQ